MKLDTPYKCDVCGKIKQIANRWLLGRSFAFLGADFIGISPWHERLAAKKEVKHLCSDQCALAWQQKELEGLGR